MKKQLIFFVIIGLAFALSMNAQEQKKPMGGAKMEKEQTETTRGADQKKSMGSISDKKEGEMKAKTSGTPKANFTGTVVSLNGVYTGSDGKVSEKQAMDLANKAQPIVFMADNGRLYIVYNTDGSFASKSLAKYAGKKIGIQGKLKVVKGVNVIIAERIVEM